MNYSKVCRAESMLWRDSVKNNQHGRWQELHDKALTLKEESYEKWLFAVKEKLWDGSSVEDRLGGAEKMYNDAKGHKTTTESLLLHSCQYCGRTVENAYSCSSCGGNPIPHR